MADQPNELAGVGTTAQMTSELAHWQDRVGLARSAGASWDDISASIMAKRQQAVQMGVPQEDLNKAMGFKDADELMSRLTGQAQQRMAPAGPVPEQGAAAAPTEPKDFATEFMNGLKSSSGGLILGGEQHILPEDAGFAARIAYHAGESIGDIPAMVVGGAGGLVAGGVGSIETGPGAAVGAAMGMGAGAMALPEFIKQEYASAMTKGQTTGPQDFVSRQMAVLWNTAKQAAVGAVTGGAGKLAGIATEAIGVTGVKALVARTGAELATMVTAGKAVQGQLPNWQDLIDGAVLLGAMHGAFHVAGSASTAATNLLDNWSKTGEQPKDAVAEAANNPVVRQQLTLPFNPEPPAGSSETMTPEGSIVMPHSPELEVAGEVQAPPEPVEAPPEGEPAPATDIWEGASGRWAVETNQSFLTRMGTNMWSIYRELFNKSYAINQLQDMLIKKGIKIPDAFNPKVLRRVAEISSTTSQYMVQNGMINGARERIGPSLNEIVKPFDKEVGDRTFWNYALSRVALADPTKDVGVPLDKAVARVKDGDADYADAFGKLVEWRNGTLAYARDHGTISNEDYLRITANAEAGLPVRRQEAEGAWGHAKGPKGKMATQTIGEREGSDLPVLNMRAELMRDAFIRVSKADAARANRATADMAAQIGMATRIDKGLPTGEVEEKDENIGWTTEQDTVPIWRDGEKEVWRFADPEITNFMRSINENGDDAVAERVTAWLANIQRQGITLNPLFPVRLMTYDVPWQFITKPGAQNTVGQVVTGMRALLFGHAPEGHGYDEWLRSGGAERVFGQFSQNNYIRDILADKADPSYTDGIMAAIKTPFNALQKWSHAITQFQRVGKFIQERQAGTPMEMAGALSTEAAFHRPGFGGALGQELNALHPFFAAYLNGLEQTTKSLLGIGKTIDDQSINPVHTILKASIVITAPVMSSWLAYKDEEWYKAIPDWQKDSGFFPAKGVFIPLPPVLNFIFGAIPRRLAEAFLNDNPHAADHLISGLASSFAPPISSLLTANIAEPILEKIWDHAFVRGEPDRETDKRLPADRWGPYTSETAKGLAKFLSDVPLVKGAELTPYEIDNFIGAWSGTLGTAAVKYSEQALQQAGIIKANAPALKVSDLPLINSWSTRYPSASAQPIEDFMDRVKQSEELHGSLHQLLQTGDADRFMQLIQENPASAALHLRGLGKNVIPGDNDIEGQTKAMQDLNDKMMKMRPDLEAVLATSKGLTLARTFAQDIAQLPVGKPLQPLEQRTVSQITKQLGMPDKPQLSANDKRQLLDQTYSIMQLLAEKGTRAMDKLGME